MRPGDADDASLPPEVLREYRRLPLEDDALARVASRLGPSLHKPVLARPSVARRRRPLVWLVAAAVLVITVASAAYFAARQRVRSSASSRTSTSAPTGVPSSLAPEPLPSVTAPAIATGLPSATAAPPPSLAVTASASAPVNAPTEEQLLRAARHALALSPARALGLVREHERAYPRGAMCSERELIAIDALVRMGRYGEAKLRATRFETSFPDSPYKLRVQQLVTQKTPAPAHDSQ